MSSLLDADFLRRLERLRLAARRRFAGAAGGARRSLRRGASVEFADHRAYAPGDDVRRIDWNAYARLEELVLRLYIAEEDLNVYLLIDTSASMGFGDPHKIEIAKRLAAALAYVGLCGSERVSIVPWSSSLQEASMPARGRGRVGSTFRFIEGLTTSAHTDLSACVDALLARRQKPGLAIVLSDFLDPAGYDKPLDRLSGARFEVSLFHLLSSEEMSPELGGDHAFVDSETNERIEVSLDPHVLAAYGRRLHIFLSGLEAYAKQRGMSYVRMVGDPGAEDGGFETALVEYLRS